MKILVSFFICSMLMNNCQHLHTDYTINFKTNGIVIPLVSDYWHQFSLDYKKALLDSKHLNPERNP